jgi:hypothetical protein
MGLLERMANKVSQVRQASRAQLAHAVRLEQPVPRVQLDQQERWDLRVSEEKLALKGFKELKANLVSQVLKVQRDRWDHKDL